MSPLPRPCLTCGDLSLASHCPEHTAHPPDLRRGRDRSTVGRGSAWVKLSRRARALQPWCLDCGTRQDLTTDHTPAQWSRILASLPMRLELCDVCCRSCNSKRGPAQPGSKRYELWLQSQPRGVQGSRKETLRPGGSPAPRNSSVGVG